MAKRGCWPRAGEPPVSQWSRSLSRRDRLHDVGIAALLLLGAGVTIPLSVGPTSNAPVWFNVSWAVSITVPLVWRRRFPVPAAAIVIAVFLVGQVTVTPEPLISQIAPFIALYSVGAWEPNRRLSVVARAVFVATIVAWIVVVIAHSPARLPQQLGNFSASTVLGLAALSNTIYLVAAVAFGETAWRSARRREALEVRTAELQVERERTAEQAVALERVRIARELHDVIAHHVSVMGIQAGAARRVLNNAPEKAADSLIAIEQNARQAIEELHRTLWALRTETPPPPSLAPSTLGVPQIPDLVVEAQRAGTPTRFEILGEAQQLTPATELTLYRVAQESLTNVRKHGGSGAEATVRLQYGTSGVSLEIASSGWFEPIQTVPSSGLGHIGMRERIHALGGTFKAEPQPGGYLVSVYAPF